MRDLRKIKLGKWTKLLLISSAIFIVTSLGLAVLIGGTSPAGSVSSLVFLALALMIFSLGGLVELRSRFIRSSRKQSALNNGALLRQESDIRSILDQERAWVRDALKRVDTQGLMRSLQSAISQQDRERRATNRRIVQLAVETGACKGLFTETELLQIVPDMIQDDPLTAFWLLDQNGVLQLLPLTPRRRLSIELRSRGYLEKSLMVLDSIASVTRTERDLSALASRQSELDVLRGNYASKLQPNGTTLETIPGHVLHIVGKAFPKTESGYTLRTHYTARAQRDIGFQVSVVSQVGENLEPEQSNWETIEGVTYYTLAGSPRSGRSYSDWLDENIEGVREVVERARPALLHAHSDFFNAITAQAIGNHFGIPVIYENRGFWEESWLSRTSQKYGIEDWTDIERRWGMPDAYTLRRDQEVELRSSSAHIVTLAEVMKGHISQSGYPASQISIVPNAVSVDDFPVLTDESDDLRETYGIPAGAITVGYISSIVEYEGIDTLIEAFYDLREHVSEDVRLVIVGDGPHLLKLEALNARLGAAGVTFTGRVRHDEVLRYYGLIDIFVVPRRPSKVCQLVTPLKPFEAFSTGRTVVMSDVEALKEIAEDSGAATLFTAGDKDSLSDTLRGLIASEQQRKSLAHDGAAWVRSERTWASNAQRYAEVYANFEVLPYTANVVLAEAADKVDYEELQRWILARDISDYIRWFDTETGASPEEIETVGWTLTGFPPVPLSLPLDWDTLCTTNRSWAFHLHAWEFMDPMVRAYMASRDLQLLEWCLDRALSWLDTYVTRDSGRDDSMAWYDMSLGLRSPRLVGLIALAFDAGIDASVVRRLLLGAFKHRHEHYLDKSFNPRTNHGYYAAVGQTVLGRTLRPLVGMAELESQGEQRLGMMAAAQFKEDGLHSEHSPDYHRMVLRSFELCIEQGLIRDPEVIERVEKAAHALGWLIQPNGRLVQFGDTPERVMSSNRAPLSADDNTNFLISNGSVGRPNDKTLAVYPHAGYAFVRQPQPMQASAFDGSSYLAFSSAFHSRAHKHADDHTFVWYDRGAEILVDAGRFGYGELLPMDSPLRSKGYYYSAPERQYVESTIAHNTVALDGENHERRRRKPFGSGLRDCYQEDEIYVLTGVVDHPDWSHHRRLTFLPGRWLVVEDDIADNSGQPRDMRSWFNLAGNFDLEVYDNTVKVSCEDWDEPLWVASDAPDGLIVPVRGQTDPLRGWRSVRDRTMTETWSLGFAAYQETAAVLTTVFNFGEYPLQTDPR